MSPQPPRDPRLPPRGTILRREHAGVVHRIVVLERGFRYAGRTWRSLSAIAHHVTGTAWNGLLWAGLTQRRRPPKPTAAPQDEPPKPAPERRRPGRPIAPRRT